MFVEMLFNTSCQDVSVAVASFPGTMIELSTIFLRAKRYSMRYVLAAAETIVAIIYSAPRVRILVIFHQGGEQTYWKENKFMF